MELSAFAEEHDFLYPPDPGEKSATIGGSISTNAGGMRAVKYGVTRDYVRGLTVVLPNGEIQTLEAIKASTTEMNECDVVVPDNQVDTFIKYTHELAEEFNVRIPSFGHAGDGSLHVYICRDALNDGDWKTPLYACFDRMYQKAVELGGLVSGEHGIGYARKEFLRRHYGEPPSPCCRASSGSLTKRTF